MPKIIFTEIQRREIRDCLPKTGAREAYLADLEHHVRTEPILWVKMRGGKMKPFAKAASHAIEKLENCVVPVEDSFSSLAQAHREDKRDPIPEDEVATEINKIRESISRLRSIQKDHTFYFSVLMDGRKKLSEKSLIHGTLGLWCRHFPNHLFPQDPRQGRLSGGHEESPALRLCGIVIEAATGKKQKDIRRLYAAVLDEWKTSGDIFISARGFDEMMYELVLNKLLERGTSGDKSGSDEFGEKLGRLIIKKVDEQQKSNPELSIPWPFPPSRRTNP